ncbi:MAG: DegT/DnrJ/EryC1/StrS family aminotransferase, partial [Planctomycetota bacterium]|nr:DegT/DnrJ/EryC1/StrS family aminotransferase [Planctomycetota bacterium]
MIPFVDLRPEYEICREAIDSNIGQAIAKQQFIGGEMVAAFEKEMAQHQGCEEIVTCGNGTDAIFPTLRVLGIGNGDEVITTPFTFFATAGAIARLGAKPVFVDIDPRTYN